MAKLHDVVPSPWFENRPEEARYHAGMFKIGRAYGLSWQIIPEEMFKLLEDQTKRNGKRAMAAIVKMKKLDLATLKSAYKGKRASGVGAQPSPARDGKLRLPTDIRHRVPA